MQTLRTYLALTAATVLTLVLTALPALATEATTGEESGRIQIADDVHGWVGLFLIALIVLAGLAGLLNAIKQLRGERDQASGEFRWR